MSGARDAAVGGLPTGGRRKASGIARVVKTSTASVCPGRGLGTERANFGNRSTTTAWGVRVVGHFDTAPADSAERCKSEHFGGTRRATLKCMVERKGIEPSTFALRTRRSPN